MPPVLLDLRRRVAVRVHVAQLYPALAILITVFAVAPLFYPGFFQSHTGYSAVYNLIDLNAHPGSLLIWAPTWGRAYDFLRMDGPLAYWLAEIFHLLGWSFLDSVKIIYALAFVFSAAGMFALARYIFDQSDVPPDASQGAGLLAAALYVYFPYHLATVFVRGAYGEAVAWALFPFALKALLVLNSRARGTARDFVAPVIWFALLMLAQPGLAILFGVLAIIAVLVLMPREERKKRSWYRSPAVYAPLPGLALGAVFLIPGLTQQSQFTAANGFVRAFVDLFQLLTASWGVSLPKGNFLEAFPYQIGIAALGLTVLALALLFQARGSSFNDQAKVTANPARRVTLFAVVTSVVLVVLMLPIASFVWDLGLNLFVQYPFQLLAFVGFLLALAAASICVVDRRFTQLPLLASLVIVPVLAAYSYLAPTFLDFAPSQPALAIYNDNELALLDAKIVRPPGTLRHGATVELDLTWQALREVNHDYTVFVHVVDDNGKTWGEEDSKPQAGAQPTLKWQPGQVIADSHSAQIDLAGPPEGYHLEVGIYQTATGERASTETGATEVRIDESQ